jgi:hypothetical protein
MNEVGGYRKDLNIALTGLDIEAKAQLVDEAFWLACPFDRDDFESVTTRIIRSDKPDPSTNEEAVALWHITLKDHDEAKVGRAVANAAVEIALSSTPGFFNVGPTTSAATPFGVYRPALVPPELVPQYVVVLDGERTVIDSVAPKGAAHLPIDHEPSVSVASGPTAALPLGTLFGARSGDKGGNANVGIFARSDEGWVWLDNFLSVDQIRRLLPETEPLEIDRYRLPALRSLNFVIHGLLEEGVAASTRQDAQAKGLGEWLRSRVVDIPTSLLNSP